MKRNIQIGESLTREQLKQIFGGDGGGASSLKSGDDCAADWEYDCSEACPCCSALCQQNATNTGTICVPIFD